MPAGEGDDDATQTATSARRGGDQGFPLKLGPRGRAEGTATLWFEPADDASDGFEPVVDASRLDDGVRRVRALAAGGLARLVPTFGGMAEVFPHAAAGGTREGESEAILFLGEGVDLLRGFFKDKVNQTTAS